MKIKFAKFFQYVDVPQGTYDKFSPSMYVNDVSHDITLDGNHLIVTHRVSGCFVIANFANVSYVRPQDGQLETSIAPAKRSAKTPKE